MPLCIIYCQHDHTNHKDITLRQDDLQGLNIKKCSAAFFLKFIEYKAIFCERLTLLWQKSLRCEWHKAMLGKLTPFKMAVTSILLLFRSILFPRGPKAKFADCWTALAYFSNCIASSFQPNPAVALIYICKKNILKNLIELVINIDIHTSQSLERRYYHCSEDIHCNIVSHRRLSLWQTFQHSTCSP